LDLSPAEAAELEALGERAAGYFEREFEPTGGAAVPPLVELRRVRYRRARLEQEAVEAVRAARQSGDSWHRIGLALGTTAEAARRRYKDAAAS
jgi:hypothetical protein